MTISRRANQSKCSFNLRYNLFMDHEVIIYSTPTCHFCQMAKEFFKEKGIAYTEYNVLADLEKRKEMVERSGQLGVPVIVIGDKTVVGFDRMEISNLLEL